VWNTPELARLRLLLHASLRPSAEVAAAADHVRAGIAEFAARKRLAPSYVALHLPLGEGWREYCRADEVGGGDEGGGGEEEAEAAEWEACDMPSEEVTQVLEERRVGEVSRLLYVASGVLNISEVMALHRQRFVVMTKARFTLEIQPDVASAVDYAVCATASLFVGNAYSAFSYLLREGALVRGAAERAGYYNLDASDGGGELGDITRREAVRWGVLPLGTRQLGAG